MDRSPEKWERTHLQFDNVGIPIERFPAVDGRSLEIPTICPYSGAPIVMSHGQYGCYLSHLAVIQEAKNQDLDYVLIFEDDVELCEDFSERLHYLFKSSLDFDMFYFGCDFGNDRLEPTGVQMIYKYNGGAGTHGYMLSKSIYDYILSNFRFDRAIDGFYSTAIGGSPDSRLHNKQTFNIKGFWPQAVGFYHSFSETSETQPSIENHKMRNIHFRKQRIFEHKGP